jgi:hypothetical protein
VSEVSNKIWMNPRTYVNLRSAIGWSITVW